MNKEPKTNPAHFSSSSPIFSFTVSEIKLRRTIGVQQETESGLDGSLRGGDGRSMAV